MANNKNERKYAIDNKLIMERWDFSKNQEINLDPAKLSEGSHIKAFFICPNCNNTWFGEIRLVIKRDSGGCNVCAEKIMRHKWMLNRIQQSTSLFVSNPELEKEWDYEMNDLIGLNPNLLPYGSNKTAYWICPRGHKYLAIIANRTRNNTGCKYCAGQDVLEGFNDLATTRPDVLAEWDFAENEKKLIAPNTVTRGSNDEVSWICPAGHKYVKKIKLRCAGQGCPVCAKESHTSFPEQAIFFYVSKIFPDAINRFGKPEIDIFIPSLNFGIEYDGEYYHKDKNNEEKKKDAILALRGIHLVRVKEVKKKVTDTDNTIYCIPASNNEYLDEVLMKIQNIMSDKYGLKFDFNSDISRDRIAIEEQYVVSVKKSSIAYFLPEIVKEWDYNKNGLINPEYVSRGSHREYYWICSNGHGYLMSPKERSVGRGCPICTDYKFLKGHNDFCSKYQHLASLWDNDKNGVRPEEVKYNDDSLHWWRCSKGHSFQTTISKIVKYNGCLACTGHLTVLVKGVNDLVTMFPEIASEWDYEKNKRLPEEYLAKSNKQAFWKCKICGGRWESMISNRINCPFCKYLNVYDIQTAELVKTFETISELCTFLGVEYSKQHGNITSVCQRNQKTIKGRYIIRYRKDDEFYNLTVKRRRNVIDSYLHFKKKE